MAYIRYLTDSHIDFGAVKLLAAECARVGMAHAMGPDLWGDDSADLANAVGALKRRLKPSTGLAALGPSERDFDRVIDGAMADHCHTTGPRVATREDCRDLLLQSM